MLWCITYSKTGVSQWEKPRELVDAERKNRNSTDDDDVVILAETAWKSDKEKTKDDDEPMIVEELICVDGPVKKEQEKAVSNEQQKFRNELTNKMSLIESLKKKLKTVQVWSLNK